MSSWRPPKITMSPNATTSAPETLFCVQFYVNLRPITYLLSYFEEDK
jgi:hypothetical protein